MNYFYACKTANEAKEVYREQSKKLHPDMGGSNALMTELNRQYEAFLKEKDREIKGQQFNTFEHATYTNPFTAHWSYFYNASDNSFQEFARRHTPPHEPESTMNTIKLQNRINNLEKDLESMKYNYEMLKQSLEKTSYLYTEALNQRLQTLHDISILRRQYQEHLDNRPKRVWDCLRLAWRLFNEK